MSDAMERKFIIKKTELYDIERWKIVLEIIFIL